jgi:hypothetical protein
LKKDWIATQVLINHFQKGKGEELSSFFPDLKEIPEVHFNQIEVFTKLGENFLSRVHYSWLIPLIETFSKPNQTLVVKALPDPLGKKIAKFLNISFASPLKGVQQQWILNRFLSSWKDFQNTLPLPLIPECDASFLLKLKKDEILDLIDFLAIFDLSQEIRVIVDKKLIQNLYLCLNDEKQKFLKVCLHQKEKVPAPPLNLEHWDGDAEKLNRILHHRGLVRLAVAISGQPKDFIWHFIHILDSGRGEKLKRYIKSEKMGFATEQRMQQIQIALKTLQKRTK